MNKREFSDAISHLSDIISNYENILKAFSNIDVISTVNNYEKDIKIAKEHLSNMESAFNEKIDDVAEAISDKEKEESEKEKLESELVNMKGELSDVINEYKEFENSILVRFATR